MTNYVGNYHGSRYTDDAVMLPRNRSEMDSMKIHENLTILISDKRNGGNYRWSRYTDDAVF
jgi:hypothetical protein